MPEKPYRKKSKKDFPSNQKWLTEELTNILLSAIFHIRFFIVIAICFPITNHFIKSSTTLHNQDMFSLLYTVLPCCLLLQHAPDVQHIL